MQNDNFRACLFMALSMAGFTINDTIVKSMTDDISIAQIMLARGLIMLVFLSAFMALTRVPFKLAHATSKPMVIRVGAEAFATITFLTGLAQMPIANVSAILQALPLTVTLAAWLFLSEPLGWRRMTAIIVGFIGVLIVVRPGTDGFNIYSLLIVLTVFFAASRDLATRALSADIPSVLVSLLTTLIVSVLGAALLVPYGGWQPMSALIWGKLVAASILLFVGYQCIVIAMRTGDVAIVAPFRYTALLWAILLGYLAFDDIPDWPMILGALLIVASGLYSLYRENRLRRSGKPASTMRNPPPARGT